MSRNLLISDGCVAIFLDAIITVVDAKHLLQNLDKSVQGNNQRSETQQQIAFADRIILNKIDLVDSAVVVCDSFNH
jgi:G3E family GTPase